MLSDFNNIRESCISTKFAQSVLVVITFQFVPDILAIGLLLVHDLEGVGVFINELVGTNNGSECPASTSLPVLTWQALYSSHKSETAP